MGSRSNLSQPHTDEWHTGGGLSVSCQSDQQLPTHMPWLQMSAQESPQDLAQPWTAAAWDRQGQRLGQVLKASSWCLPHWITLGLHSHSAREICRRGDRGSEVLWLFQPPHQGRGLEANAALGM